MNAIICFPTPILGIDTSRVPVTILEATPDDSRPGAVIPKCWRQFEQLENFREYWEENWASRPVITALPRDSADPLQVRRWLAATGQQFERFEWLDYRSHLRNDLTLRNIGIGDEYRRAYALALYANYKLNANEVAVDLWGSLLEACAHLDDIRHGAHRLAVALHRLSVEDIPY